MELKTILKKINTALDELYKRDIFLFEENLCERCINHRFAVHLENQKFPGYFIDCEYNKSHIGNKTITKRVSNDNGNYIDILIRKRNKGVTGDLACFEIKKWNNRNPINENKDRGNLKILTDQVHFAYKFGFYIIYGKERDKVKIEIYKQDYQKINKI